MNIALQYLDENNKTLDEFNGICGELVDAIIHWRSDGSVSILYIEEAFGGLIINEVNEWSYHMVPVIDNLVHDAWIPNLILGPEEYIKQAFPRQAIEGQFYGGDRDEERISIRG